MIPLVLANMTFTLNILDFFIELSGNQSDWESSINITDEAVKSQGLTITIQNQNFEIPNIGAATTQMNESGNIIYQLLILPEQTAKGKSLNTTQKTLFLDAFAYNLSKKNCSPSCTVNVTYSSTSKKGNISASYDGKKSFYQPFISSTPKFTFSFEKKDNGTYNKVKIEFNTTNEVNLNNKAIKLNGIYFNLPNSNQNKTHVYNLSYANVINSPIDRNQDMYFFYENVKNTSKTIIQFYNNTITQNLYSNASQIGVDNQVKITLTGEAQNISQQAGKMKTEQIIVICVLCVFVVLFLVLLILCINTYKKSSIKAPIISEGWSVATDVQQCGYRTYNNAARQPGIKQLWKERKKEKYYEKQFLFTQKGPNLPQNY